MQSIRSLLQSERVTEPTRRVLLDRLDAARWQPTFFAVDEFALLQAVCARLIPQDDRSEADQIDIAGGIDRRLAENKSDGWRYDTMPPDGEAYRLGLQGIDQSAVLLFGSKFQQLTDSQKDEILTAVQSMDAPGGIWQTLPADRFFEELLSEATNTYYSHPLAQQEIHYLGMADATGWVV